MKTKPRLILLIATTAGSATAATTKSDSSTCASIAPKVAAAIERFCVGGDVFVPPKAGLKSGGVLVKIEAR